MARGGMRLAATAAAVAAAIVLPGCSSSDNGDGGSAGTGDTAKLSVVASTNVYGDIAARIGGDRVSVTSIIKDPSQDPHSYQADTRTRLAISKADVVIKNGGGYDDFVTTMLAEGSDATVLDAVSISGKKAPAGGDLNEHVWYDFPSMRKLADRLAATLGKAEPDARTTFEANAASFAASLHRLESDEAQLAAAHRGAGVAITEPVPLYLLQAAGLVNKTPAKFSEAIEEGDDVSVGVLNQTLDLFKNGDVTLLAYNEQTSGAETDRVKAAAQQNKVPVVGVTETLPAGKNYLTWMTGNLDAVKTALGG